MQTTSEKLFWAALCGAGLLAAQGPRRVRLNEQDVAEGRLVYNRSCTVCHGLDGTVGDRGPALAGARRYLRRTEEDLLDAVRNGIPGAEMPPAGLSAADARKVVAYIRSLRATASDAPAPGDVTHGQEIFWGKGGCGGCHMIRGRGGITGPDLSSVAAQRTLRALREALTVPRPHIPRGYQPVDIVTTGGEIVAGIVKNENNFSMQLLDSSGKLRLFTRDELRQVTYKKDSLMPNDYDRQLISSELQDLLAFLSRQSARKERE
ncbi:MAG: c-type cytochrome [Acidobacteria bacterium]|nr:c-type cytochrome [Acidobacteriota bacterium]